MITKQPGVGAVLDGAMETWAKYGACRGVDSETFFDSDDFVDGPMANNVRYSENSERQLRAKLICSGCHVREQCLQHALDNPDDYSVRGGYTAVERRQLMNGLQISDYGYNVRTTTPPARTRGWTLVKRFAAGERLMDLCGEFGLKRSTALQEIRLGLVTGAWRIEASAA